MAENQSSWLARYGRNPNASARLFCFHFAGGSASAFRGWPRHLSNAIELVAVQLPGREGRVNEAFITTIGDLTRKVVDAMTPWLDKPYVVFGHSLGAISAFEVLREVKRRKLAQPFLFIPAGRQAPHLKDSRKPIASLPDDSLVEELANDYGNGIARILESPD